MFSKLIERGKALIFGGFMFMSFFFGSNAARGHGGEEEILPSNGLSTPTVDGATVTSSLESGSSSTALVVGVVTVAVLGIAGAGWVLFRNKEDSAE